MHVLPTELPDCLLIEPRCFADERGWFLETYHGPRYAVAGLPREFVQDNHSQSQCGVVRGLHYQLERPQGKLVWVVRGEIFDVAVDLRKSSPTFGRWTSVVLNASDYRQFYVPPGFAHGFCALAADTQVVYKCTEVYSPADERTIVWNDPTLGINWPIASPLLSEKDRSGMRFEDAPYFT